MNVCLSLNTWYIILFLFYSASSLKQQSAGRHVAPLWHIILIPSSFSVILRALRRSNIYQFYSVINTISWILICAIFRPGVCKNTFLYSVLHWRIVSIKLFFQEFPHFYILHFKVNKLWFIIVLNAYFQEFMHLKSSWSYERIKNKQVTVLLSNQKARKRYTSRRSSIPQILYQNRENIHFLHIPKRNRANKKGFMLRRQ
jgi:hypothetical protein